ncbi:unnamed protein product [Auanema sp. JU1783]|nr:unnamed protein product [Auanema sp. JU1783]
MHSDSMSESEDLSNDFSNRTIFICGFITKRWHNSSLLAIIHDLLPNFFLSCNNDTHNVAERSREMISNADVMIFFVNEFTISDTNCLKMLQYAWHLMIPIIMLRPPKTKLVISKRQNRRTDMHVGNGSISRIATEPIGRFDLSNIDYSLLQDILHEGYKRSIVYNRQAHERSMKKLHERLENLFKKNNINSFSTEQPPFFLSPSRNSNSQLVVSNIASAKTSPIHTTKSLSNLATIDTKTPKMNKATPVHTPLKKQSSWGFATSFSRDSSFERRMSLSHFTIDDLSNFQQTQYLVFPLKDGNKKPTLVKFPDDLIEEKYKEESLWGSDTSLEEEAKNASRIARGISIDVEETSPISSPPPYIEDI